MSLQFINDNMAKKHRYKQKKKGKASGAPKHKNSAKKPIPTDPRVENVNSGSEAADDADHAASECPYSITDALSWLQSATSGQDDDSEVKHGEHE